MIPRPAGNVFWSGLEALVSGLLSFASTCIVARLVGPSELGVGAAAVAVHVILWVAVNGLFADALVQRGKPDGATAAAAVWASTGAGVLAALLQAGSGWLLAAWMEDARLLPMCLLLALPLPLVGAAGAAQGVLTLRRAYRVLAWRAIFGQGIGTLVGIVAARTGAGAWAPVLQQSVVSSAGALTLLAGILPPIRHWHTAPRMRWPVVLALLRVGAPLCASTLVLHGRYRAFALLIGGFAGPSVLGQVHVAFRLVETVRELVSTAQWRLMLPILAERKHDLPAMRAACEQMLGLSSRVTLPIAGAMALSLPVIVPLVLGPSWAETGWAAEPLAGLMALSMLMFPSGIALVARGRTAAALALNIGLAGATVLSTLLMRPSGALPAVLTWAAAQLLVTPFALWVNGRALRTGPLEPLASGKQMLAITLAAMAAASALAGLVHQPDSPVQGLALRLAVFAVAVVPAALRGRVYRTPALPCPVRDPGGTAP